MRASVAYEEERREALGANPVSSSRNDDIRHDMDQRNTNGGHQHSQKQLQGMHIHGGDGSGGEALEASNSGEGAEQGQGQSQGHSNSMHTGGLLTSDEEGRAQARLLTRASTRHSARSIGTGASASRPNTARPATGM